MSERYLTDAKEKEGVLLEEEEALLEELSENIDVFWSDLFEEVQHDIQLGMNCRLLLKPDQVAEENGWQGRWYYQIECDRPDSITGEMGTGRGGKAYLSPTMTKSELVQCALGLYLAYWNHEARETFRWQGRQVFGPHIDVEAHWSIAERTEFRDER